MEAISDVKARVASAIAAIGGSVHSTSSLGLPYFSVHGGPLRDGGTQMGWHIRDNKGFTDAVSCSADFAHLSVCAPLMAKTLLRLLFHWERGDELKDFADDIYAACHAAFQTNDTDALCEAYKELCEW